MSVVDVDHGVRAAHPTGEAALSLDILDVMAAASSVVVGGSLLGGGMVRGLRAGHIWMDVAGEIAFRECIGEDAAHVSQPETQSPAVRRAVISERTRWSSAVSGVAAVGAGAAALGCAVKAVHHYRDGETSSAVTSAALTLTAATATVGLVAFSRESAQLTNEFGGVQQRSDA